MTGAPGGGKPRRTRPQRPRDALGRPLPYGSTGVEPVPEEALPPHEALAYARSLIEAGRPFAAHEVLEARWKAAPDVERPLWQGLAQLCVALTHAARGNSIGARRLLERGAGRILDYCRVSDGHTPRPAYGLDLDAVVTCTRLRVMAAQADEADRPTGDGSERATPDDGTH